ncbi:Gfo/Idh/MocA family oxidoreductase [Williamsia sp. CHRR-6]|nr:Gfo/Idh/MocA family oxidoreductase [Williamsia sp. CHRR-6]
MRIGVIGGGPWARETHIPALAAHPGVTLTGVWTRRPAAAAELPTPRFDSVEALFEACDAVSFAVPPQVQAQVAIAAARAGKHVILDKPIAGDLDTARALATAIAEADVRSVVTFTRRFAPETKQFVAAARAGRYGGGMARWISGALLAEKYAGSQWRHDHGAILDIGPHVFDLLDAALGPITAVVDACHVGDGDLWQVTLDHQTGATSVAQMALKVPARPTVNEFSVHGVDGVVSLTGRVTESPACFAVLIDEFLAAVATGTEHELNVQRGLHIQQIIESVRDRVR